MLNVVRATEELFEEVAHRDPRDWSALHYAMQFDPEKFWVVLTAWMPAPGTPGGGNKISCRPAFTFNGVDGVNTWDVDSVRADLVAVLDALEKRWTHNFPDVPLGLVLPGS